MIPAQVIQRKRDGHGLTEAEIRDFILGFTRGEIPDYQMSALAMAVCFQGMTGEETMSLTRAMVESGETIQWNRGAPGGRALPFLADKHSTGGIGDKTSLILAPLMAAIGLRVPMVSGRGLGPTGGTLDKLESIPGYRTNLSLREVAELTDRVGCVITGQTAELAPADKKLYALRDVTATVSCLPLIVASIMSKKLAENVDGLVLDVKWGTGAFMKTRADSLALARAMVEVGQRYGKKVVALQTDMNQPLGRCIGNALEVRECLDILTGKLTSGDLLDVTLALGNEMLALAGVKVDLRATLASGAAWQKFCEMVVAQGGNPAAPLLVAKYLKPIPATKSGFVREIACDQFGYAVIALGGGRQKASDTIDFCVGFTDPKQRGDRVRAGEPLAVMHYNDAGKAAVAEQLVQQAYVIGDAPPPVLPLIVERIG
jgi:pyrimidine-nucleoside phosphorylase